MPVTFGPVAGTDRIDCGARNSTSTWSLYGWWRRASGTRGQFFSISNGTEEIGVYISSSTTDRLTIDRATSGTGGQWQVTGANDRITHSATQWVFLAITQSGIGTPVVYTASPAQSVALGTCTVTTAVSPTGTANTSVGSAHLYLGNWSGFDYALAGDMAWWGFHNVVLTQGEIQEAMDRGYTHRGLVFATSLESTSVLFDLSGNAASMTNTGAADLTTTDAPVVPKWIQTDGWFVQQAATAVTIAAAVASMTLSAPAAALSDTLTASPASLTLSAAAPALTQTDVVLAAVSSLGLSAATPALSNSLVALPATITLSAAAGALLDTLTPTSALMTLSAAAPTLTQADTVVVPAGALITLDGAAPVVVSSITSPAGDLALSAASPALSDTISAGTSALMTLSGPAPALYDTLAAGTATITLSAVEPGLVPVVTVVAPPGTITLDGATPTLNTGVTTITAPSGTLTLSMPVAALDGLDTTQSGNWFLLHRRRRVR